MIMNNVSIPSKECLGSDGMSEREPVVRNPLVLIDHTQLSIPYVISATNKIYGLIRHLNAGQFG